MKSKTLVLISAAIITTAAIVLTLGLSLLHSSAIGEELISGESAVPVSEAPTAEDAEKTEEILTEDAPISDSDIEFEDIEDLIFLEDKKTALYCNDMIFDIYEHETGKFVGQLVITDDELYEECGKMFRDSFDYTKQCFDTEDPNAEPVCLPKTKYRVEAHGIKLLSIRDNDQASCWGGAFSISFSYGADECIWEFTQIGLTFRGCDEFIAKLNELVSDKIAEIEAGNAEAPEHELSKLLYYDTDDGYWNIVGRYVPRFPYIED